VEPVATSGFPCFAIIRAPTAVSPHASAANRLTVRAGLRAKLMLTPLLIRHIPLLGLSGCNSLNCREPGCCARRPGSSFNERNGSLVYVAGRRVNPRPPKAPRGQQVKKLGFSAGLLFWNIKKGKKGGPTSQERRGSSFPG
jgi:hypothetical protein